MTTNIYSPPTANLDGESSPWGDGGTATKFYVVGPLKFWLLYVSTLGFYKIYWFYKNWSLYKAQTKESMWPVARGIFTIFFVHSLFRSVERTIDREGRDHQWNPELVATLYVVFQLANTVLDRISNMFGTTVIWIELIIMVPVLGSLVFSAQRAINTACGDPQGASNSKLGFANYCWIVVGGIVLVLAILGTITG